MSAYFDDRTGLYLWLTTSPPVERVASVLRRPRPPATPLPAEQRERVREAMAQSWRERYRDDDWSDE